MKIILFIFIIFILLSTNALGVCTAIVNQQPNGLGIINVYGTDKEADISCIISTLNNNSAIFWNNTKESILNVPIIVNDTTTILYINNSDIDWLKLLSLNNSNVAYIKIQGSLNVNNTKITSWDTTLNNVAPNTYIRSYIYSTGSNSIINVDYSNISNLGDDIYPRYGIFIENSQQFNNISNSIIYYNYMFYNLLSNNTIINNVSVYGNTADGLRIANSSNITILNSNFSNNIKDGIAFYGSNNKINNYINNTIISYNFQRGFFVSTPIYNFTMNNSNIFSNQKDGMYIGYMNNSIFYNNKIYNNTERGMNFIISNNNNISNNTIYSQITGHGIYLSNSSNNTINDNIIYSNYYSGIYIYNFSLYNQLIYNTINNSEDDCGIAFMKNASNNNISNNDVFDNDADGICLEQNSNNNNISYNNFYLNNHSGIYIGRTPATITPESVNNQIYSNNIHSNILSGITLYYANGTIISIDNNIYNNSHILIMTNVSSDINFFNSRFNPSSLLNVSISKYNITNDYYKKFNESTYNTSLAASYIIGDLPSNKNINVQIYWSNGTKFQDFYAKSNNTGYIKYNSTGYEFSRYTIIEPLSDTTTSYNAIVIAVTSLIGGAYVILRRIRRG